MKRSLLIIFILISTIIHAEIIKGIVVEMYSNEPIYLAKIKIIFQDGELLNIETNIKGEFEFIVHKKIFTLITSANGYENDTINNEQLIGNDNIILLIGKPKGIIDEEPVKYKDEERNPNFEYKIKGQVTTNYIDSLGRRQGRWVITRTDKYDKNSKYYYGQPMSIGYYRNNEKIGKWIILDSEYGKIKDVIFFNSVK